ncbi:MAG: type II toxin-antitoxin system RelE/ParE family toxin [Rhizobiaceae bacterium]
MIRSFADRQTEQLFDDIYVRAFSGFDIQARRRLQLLHSAASLEDLKVPPGNRLEMLKGNRQGQYSIRINGQWRICFTWIEGHAHDVEIVDYH